MSDMEEILGDLIAIKTDDLGNGNKECVDYISQKLSQNGVLFRRIAHAESKCESIIAGVNVQELKNVKTGLVLSGHFDTVSVNPKDWDTNPFAATNVNGLIYGRGTVDMKYFIAVVLSLLPELKKLEYPVFLLFSGDEETKVEGIRLLTSFLQMRNITPKFALIGEPTNFQLCVAHKGYSGYTTECKGVSAHSSRPDLGVNAIYAAAQLVTEIEKLNAEYMPKKTTLNVGFVCGGVQRNAIPSEASFDWEIRYSEEKHKADVFADIKQKQKELAQAYKRLFVRTNEKESLFAFEYNQESLILQIAKDILNTNIITLPVATEAGFLQQLGIDTLICGAGDEKLAHTSSEHIKATDLLAYRNFLLKFTQEVKRHL